LEGLKQKNRPDYKVYRVKCKEKQKKDEYEKAMNFGRVWKWREKPTPVPCDNEM